MFANPGLLVLLLLPVALVAAYAVRQRSRAGYAIQFTNLDLLDEIAPDRPGWRRHLPAVAFVLAMSALVIGIARPLTEVEVPVEASTVVLAMDVSISMAANDVAPNRLAAAQDAALRFMDEVPDQVRVGMVTFAETAVAVVSPTSDRGPVRDAIERLQLRPGTAIGEALLTSVDMIAADLAALQAESGEDEPNPATIVLLSDGDTTAGRPDAVGVRAAREAGIAVSTISFGTNRGVISFQGQLLPVPANGRALRGIAADTGGRFYDAETGTELTEVFEELGVAVGVTTEEVEVVVPFMVAALILGVAAGIMSLRWSSRLP